MTDRLRPWPGAADLLAGISVALVLIPQSLAYAELAGLPPQVGLFAAALPLILAAPFASSPYLQTGPVALTGLLTFGALQGLAEPFSDEYVELAILLALLVGIFRLVLGILRLGNIAYLLSSPVLMGFTTGAAILIVASQLPRALGSAPQGDGVLADGFQALTSPGDWSGEALVVAVAAGALILAGRRAHRLFPGVLVAVIAAIFVSSAFGHGGETIGDIPGGFIQFHGSFPWGSTASLIPAAAAIALVGFAEPASIARTYAAQDRQAWDANKEMLGQGVANVVSAFSGGLPVGGSFSRSSLSRLAGAKTTWTGAITGFIVLLALPFAPVAEPLPRSVLAAIVIVSVLKLVDVRALWRLANESLPQSVVALGTLAATLAFSPRVERGVFVGVSLAVAVHLYRELNLVTEEELSRNTLTIRPQGVLWFATVPKIERIVRTNLADEPGIEFVIIDMSGVGRLDYTGAATLRQSIEVLQSGGVTVEIRNVPHGAKRAVTTHLANALPDNE